MALVGMERELCGGWSELRGERRSCQLSGPVCVYGSLVFVCVCGRGGGEDHRTYW